MQRLTRFIGLDQFEYPYTQFCVFRVILSAYLIIHFLALIPYAPELFSRAGLIPDPSLLATYKIFPNLLVAFDSPIGTQIFVSILALLSFLLLIDWKRPWVAFILWYGWACLFNRNLFIGNPGLPFIGWILLALSLVPQKSNEHSEWRFPPGLFWGAWLILSLGYTISGIHKLSSPSWLNGTAIARLLENPLARDVPWRNWLLMAPPWLTQGLTYTSLGLEVFFLPLALFHRTRPWIWLAMIGMHLGILTLVSFADLTLGVLMIHFMTFDSRWLASKPKKQPDQLVLFFDGVCGLCSSVVDFVMSNDKSQRFKFSPLQGEFATQTLSTRQTQNLESLVLLENGQTFEKSDAVIRIGMHLGGIFRMIEIFKFVPLSIRNKAYSWVASHRYRWFGKKETCRLPTPSERSRFIL